MKEQKGFKNREANAIPKILVGHVDKRWANNTIYNHFENPIDFMNTVIEEYEINKTGNGDNYIDKGKRAYEKINKKDTTYNKLYEDVAKKVKGTLHARGFTSKMLYGDVEFTTQNTGCLSKQRAMMGRRDCYFSDPTMDDGKLFHDIYINLSYHWGIDDKIIENNSYALYALTKELSRLVPIRVFVVNHVGTRTPTCYSYCLKKFRQPINAKQFLFFTSDSKRTFGWASYDQLSPGFAASVGSPEGTVSIANFNLEKEVDTIWEKLSRIKGHRMRQ